MKNLGTKTASVFGKLEITFLTEMEHTDLKDLEDKITALIAGSEMAGKLSLKNARKDFHLNVGTIDIGEISAMNEDEELIDLFQEDLVLA